MSRKQNAAPTSYDDFPIAVFICEPEEDRDGNPYDYRIVYGNEAFATLWQDFFHNVRFLDALVAQDHFLPQSALRLLDRFYVAPPKGFRVFLPDTTICLHLRPVPGLPRPCRGFFVTDLSGDGEQDLIPGSAPPRPAPGVKGERASGSGEIPGAREHFLRAIRQMNANSVLMRQHQDGRLEAVFVSASFAAMMECPEERAVEMMDGLKFFKTTHPEDRPFERSMIRRHVTDDGTSDLTIQKITARHNRIWCRVHYAFLDDFNEHYIFCTYTDVTALKQYEERLRNVYMTLGNNQANPRTLVLIRVNLTKNAIEEVRGPDLYDSDSVRYPYMEVLSRRASHYPIRAERERFLKTFHRENLSAGYLGGTVTASEVLYSRRKNGRFCYVRFSANLTRHPLSGDLIAFITEEECNREKVRETLMRKILAAQFDMVAFLINGKYGVTIGDASRIRKGSIFPAVRNGEYRRYLARQVFPVLYGDAKSREKVMDALSMERIAEETRRQDPYTVNAAIEVDGEIFHKQFDFYRVNPEADFYIVLKSDTTELQRRQAQRNEQLRSALEEARQANVAKTAFLSSMSHEIRTPMNAIIGLDSIALKEPDLSPRTRDCLEKIGMSARHLLQLINDILDMSRIESGRMILKQEEFSFRTFLEQINSLVSSQCQDKGLRYECQLLGEADAYYIGDDMKLKQVLINILGNAVKFTHPPGSVTLTVRRTAAYADQSSFQFVIRDTGVGMDPDFLPHIFDAFSQEDATTTNRYGGSGLGMAISKNIVEMMNGTISVTSKKGAGSEFTVNVTLRNSVRREQIQEEAVSAQDMRVLVIDNDPVACEHAKIVLEEIGVSADTCGSGREAMEAIRLRLARRLPYNLFLVDLKMPEQDGIETTRQIRKEYGEGSSAVIILTACQWADVEAEATEAGVDAFMTKPLFAAQLLHDFQTVMQKQNLAAGQPPAVLAGRRILLAEDMEINAEIMIELLDMEDMEVEHAENGKAALDLFTSHPAGYYDAILMDVRMPEMDGLQTTAAIRALDRPDAKTIPIIAMTANAFDEDVQRSLQAGMNAHLIKPVQPERLFATLSELIREKQS